MESTEPTELVELVRRAQKGEEAAQRELIISYQHRIAGFVYAITNRSDSVEDLAQQIFIKMARALGLETVAEGVDSREQYDTLTELGCDSIQGYLLAEPMPA